MNDNERKNEDNVWMVEWKNIEKKMQAINWVFGQEALAKITGTQIIKYVIVNSVLFQNKASLSPRHDPLLAKAPTGFPRLNTNQ